MSNIVLRSRPVLGNITNRVKVRPDQLKNAESKKQKIENRCAEASVRNSDVEAQLPCLSVTCDSSFESTVAVDRHHSASILRGSPNNLTDRNASHQSTTRSNRSQRTSIIPAQSHGHAAYPGARPLFRGSQLAVPVPRRKFITKRQNVNSCSTQSVADPDVGGLENKRQRREQSKVRSSWPYSKESSVLPRTSVSQVDRLPLEPQVAVDFAREVFSRRVDMDYLIDECRYLDCALSDVHQSANIRMMEVPTYILTILAHEQARELKACYSVPDFLAAGKQPNLTTEMITTLADWVAEMQDNFSLNSETVHLAWSLFYAYLHHGQPVAKREIQLMTCAAVMVASKFEQRHMPKLKHLVFVTDDNYSADEFLDAERRLLYAIDFTVHRPNPYFFLRRYTRVLDADNGSVQFMSRFLLDAGLHSHKISLKRASLKAATVLWLSRAVLRNPSYREWCSRSDILKLRQLMQTNRSAQTFYSSLAHGEPYPLGLRDNNDGISSSSNSDPLDLSVKRAVSCRNSLIQNARENKKFLAPSNTKPVSRRITRSRSANRGGRKCHSAPAALLPLSPPSFADLDSKLQAELRGLRYADEQRCPLWPPILQHITGYQETELVPLAMYYHRIAMRLVAEAARGGKLAAQATKVAIRYAGERRAAQDNDNTTDSFIYSSQSICVSPGGHHLRRQTVTNYCQKSVYGVADAYPQLAFENLVPYFPAIQCPETCACFVCVNLMNPVS